MEKFPELRDQQVVLLRADINTGIVLDENYMFATNQKQTVYAIFENADEALEVAKCIVLERENVECGIYGIDEKIIFNITSKNVENY